MNRLGNDPHLTEEYLQQQMREDKEARRPAAECGTRVAEFAALPLDKKLHLIRESVRFADDSLPTNTFALQMMHHPLTILQALNLAIGDEA